MMMAKIPPQVRRLVPFVFWNGGVVPCCYDLEGKYIVGNLREQTLEEIWESPKYVEVRRRIDNAYRAPDNEPNMCNSCLKWGHEPWKTSDGKTVWGQGTMPPLEAPAADTFIEDLV